MNPRIRYVTVGAFVLGGAALFVMIAFWIGDGGLGRQTQPVQMVFGESVAGLTEGSPVRFMGVEVGRVRSIELLTDGAPAVRVVAAVTEPTPRGRDVRASLAFEGITGVTYVNLESRPRQPATLRGRGDMPEIATTPGNLRALMDDLPALADRVNRLLERAGSLLSDENLARAESSLAAVAELTETAADQRATFERTLTDAAAAMAELRTAADAIAATASNARAPVSRSVTDLADAAARVSNITARADRLFDRHQQDLETLLDRGLPALGPVMEELRDTLRQVQDLAVSLEEDPSQLLHRKNEDAIIVEP